MSVITKKFIFNHLEKLNIKQNDSLLLYSNLPSFGCLDRNLPKKMLKYILEYLGNNGTLFMPAYTFDTPVNFIFDINTIYKNYSTGILVNEFFKLKKIKRSFRLIHSHIGIGKKSYLLDNVEDLNSFGKASDFEIMRKNSFKCVFLGCQPSQAATYFFQLEQMNKINYRSKIFLKKRYLYNKKIIKVNLKYLSKNKLKRYDLDKAFFELKKIGAKIYEQNIRFGKSYSITLKHFHTYGNKLFKKDMNFLVR